MEKISIIILLVLLMSLMASTETKPHKYILNSEDVESRYTTFYNPLGNINYKGEK